MPFTGTPSQVGRKAKTYLNTGTNAIPTWVEIKRIPGLKMMLAKGKVKLEVRESDWEKTLAGNKTLSFTAEYVKKKGLVDAVYAALYAAFLNDTPTEIAAMDGDIAVSGAYGFRAYTLVSKFEKDEENAKAVTYSLEFDLTEYVEADVLIEPSAYTVP